MASGQVAHERSAGFLGRRERECGTKAARNRTNGENRFGCKYDHKKKSNTPIYEKDVQEGDKSVGRIVNYGQIKGRLHTQRVNIISNRTHDLCINRPYWHILCCHRKTHDN